MHTASYEFLMKLKESAAWMSPDPLLASAWGLGTRLHVSMRQGHSSTHRVRHCLIYYRRQLQTLAVFSSIDPYTVVLDYREGWCESVVVSFPSSLVGFVGFHPYMHLFSFRKLFCDLYV